MQRDLLHRGFADRLNEVCDDMGVPGKFQGRQVELAKVFELTQKGVRKWLEGEGLPAHETAIRIALWANVSVDWLLTGRGQKRPDEPADAPLRQLPDDVRTEVLDFIRYKVERKMTGDELGRYLKWLDSIIKKPPQSGGGAA